MSLTKVTNDLLALGENTSSLNLPKGTTAQRPSSPVAGMVRENTDDNVIEYYNGTEWKQVLTQDPPVLVDCLVVAGGAGGGYIGSVREPGGGGAGGCIESLGVAVPLATVLNIVIGAGGGVVTYDAGTNGSNSTIDFGSFTAIGGGGGGAQQFLPKSGGSGGGGSHFGGNQVGAAGTAGQGFAGGAGNASGVGAGGGGGGGSQVGETVPTANYGGAGGNGYQSEITGTLTYYAGGGGGCGGNNTGTHAAAGLGGGGRGGNNYVNGNNGVVNTGGGGGGNKLSGTSSTSGGSGVVILRLLTAEYSGTTTGAPTVTTDGSHTVLKYTSSGTYTA